jgi:hypothetical protein
MSCNHERLRCTDNTYFCAVCGARLFEAGAAEEAAKKVPEVKKPQGKRKTKKDGE